MLQLIGSSKFDEILDIRFCLSECELPSLVNRLDMERTFWSEKCPDWAPLLRSFDGWRLSEMFHLSSTGDSFALVLDVQIVFSWLSE